MSFSDMDRTMAELDAAVNRSVRHIRNSRVDLGHCNWFTGRGLCSATNGLCAAVGEPMCETERPADGWPSEHAITVEHLERQRTFSIKTFGPGRRTKGVLDHIRKELTEIEADPDDLNEWVDVIILAFDGAWRHGWEPGEIIDAIKAKQAKNEARTWPDWRTMSEDEAIEHDRSTDG